MRAREQQFHNAWRASAVSQESAGTTTPSTREKKKELNDVVGLSYPTSQCPSEGRSANWAITASSISFCRCFIRGCSGSACPFHTTPKVSRAFTIQPSTKSLPNGRMMDRCGGRLWPACGISPPKSNSICACSMATGPIPWPKRGGWDWVLGVQTPERGEDHRHYREPGLRLSTCPGGSRQ
jgi:hypothetical protein